MECCVANVSRASDLRRRRRQLRTRTAVLRRVRSTHAREQLVSTIAGGGRFGPVRGNRCVGRYVGADVSASALTCAISRASALGCGSGRCERRSRVASNRRRLRVLSQSRGRMVPHARYRGGGIALIPQPITVATNWGPAVFLPL